MRSRRWIGVVAASSLALTIVACGSSDKSSSGDSSSTATAQKGGTLNGAGATFPAPVYTEWAARFKDAQGTTVNYQAVGSGAGIAQFTAGTVDFGATDSAMKPDELAAAKKKGQPVHIPTVLGAVTVSYNVSGLDKGLKLDGATIADIFLGKIKKWDDAAITKLNPDVKRPSTDIMVCHRSDESGTTANFTKFLAAYSTDVGERPGQRQVRQVADRHRRQGQRRRRRLRQADRWRGRLRRAGLRAAERLHDRSREEQGRPVRRADARGHVGRRRRRQAAGGSALQHDQRRRATTTYPITAVTFLLAYKDSCKAGLDKNKAGLLKDWLTYALGDGQKLAGELQYAAAAGRDQDEGAGEDRRPAVQRRSRSPAEVRPDAPMEAAQSPPTRRTLPRGSGPRFADPLLQGSSPGPPPRSCC